MRDMIRSNCHTLQLLDKDLLELSSEHCTALIVSLDLGQLLITEG